MNDALAISTRPEKPPWREFVPKPDIISEREYLVMSIAELVRRCVIVEGVYRYDSREAVEARQKKDENLTRVLKVSPELASEGVARGYGLEAQSVGGDDLAVNQDYRAMIGGLRSVNMMPREQGPVHVIDARNDASSPATGSPRLTLVR
jgi:hypothetical protein